MAELTPMMRQYLEIKERHPDCILFFRLGDFYEMFADDAKLASHELDLTLTTRDRGKEKSEQVPMCGVPYHSAESYIARLVARGYKVAICEQMEDPALAKGLVKRDITRIVTPGTVIESSMLDESRNNYFACVFGEGGRYGLSGFLRYLDTLREKGVASEDAAAAGAAAMSGGALTAFELLCDNALMDYIRAAKLRSFGAAHVSAYLAAMENETTAARMILTGRLAGLQPAVIRERLRETYA